MKTYPNRLVLKIDALEMILNGEGIRDRYVVVVSIAGALRLRQGKSFFYSNFVSRQKLQLKCARSFTTRACTKKM